MSVLSAMPNFPRDLVLCEHCGGGGRVQSKDAKARSRKGGNASYLRSLEPGQMSMRERGRRGGRPRQLTLAEIEALERAANEERSFA